MSGFSGFLKGFATTGAEIIKSQDEDERWKRRVDYENATQEANKKKWKEYEEAAAAAAMEKQRKSILGQQEMAQPVSVTPPQPEETIVVPETASTQTVEMPKLSMPTNDINLDEEIVVTPEERLAASIKLNNGSIPSKPQDVLSTEELDTYVLQNKKAEKAKVDKEEKKQIQKEWADLDKNKTSLYTMSKNTSFNFEKTLNLADQMEEAVIENKPSKVERYAVSTGFWKPEYKGLFERVAADKFLIVMDSFKGQFSDKEGVRVDTMVPNLTDDNTTTLAKVQALRAETIRAAQYTRLMSYARKNNISVEQADMAWLDYQDANPLFEKDANGNADITKMVGDPRDLMKDDSWKEYLGGTASQKSSPTAEKSTDPNVGSFLQNYGINSEIQ